MCVKRMIKKCSWQGRKRFECFFVCVFQATQYQKALGEKMSKHCFTSQGKDEPTRFLFLPAMQE